MIQAVVLALVVAAVLEAAGLSMRRRSLVVLGVVWLAYAVYEFLMFKHVLCTGECNIRVDLLLIAPLLVIGTLAVAGWVAWRAWRSRRGRREA